MEIMEWHVIQGAQHLHKREPIPDYQIVYWSGQD